MPAKIRTLFTALVTGLLLYATFFIFIVTPLLNGLLPRVFEQQTGRELQLRDLAWQPFSLRLTATGVRNNNPDGSVFFAFEQLVADLSLRSIWQGLTFDELRVDALTVNVAQTSADRYNFSDILDHRAAMQDPAATSAPPTGSDDLPVIVFDQLAINVENFSFSGPHLANPVITTLKNLQLRGSAISTAAPKEKPEKTALLPLAARHLQLTLARADINLPRDKPIDTHFDNLRADIEFFSTTSTDAQPFSITVQNETGSTASITGQLMLTAAHCVGELNLHSTNLLPVWRHFAHLFHFDLHSGALAFKSQFDLRWQDALTYNTSRGELTLNNVALQARADSSSQLALKQLAVTGLAIAGGERRVDIDKVGVDGLQLQGWNRSADVSLQALFKTEFPATEPDNSPAWKIHLNSLHADNNRIDWRTDSLSEEALAISPLRLHARNITWPDAQPAEFDLAATINTDTTLQVQGALTPATLSGAVSGEVKGLPLIWANRYVEPQIAAYVSRGTLDTQWQMQLERGAVTRVDAEGTADNFQFLRKSSDLQLAAWRQLQFRQLAVHVVEQQLLIKRIDLQKPEARFRILEDGTNNFQQLMITAQQSASAATRTPSPAVNPAATSAGKPWQVAVAQIHLNQGELDFRDYSLPRMFRARIGNFSGDILGLSTDENAVARVDLSGSVDGYAPVSLTGTLAPLRAKPALDLALDFTNLDLATLTTYSGTYAGYAINRGLLTMQLNYQLEDNRLKGHNRIVIEQMELGERVKSPKAKDLPLRLAIALLTDENGVMDLGVDVSGDVDDPEFSVSGIIWKAVRNTIVKAVAAPFKLLAGLAGGGDENLGEVDFAPGSDAISADAHARLEKLTQALAKRPALKLKVEGHSDPATDRAALKQGLLLEVLNEEGVEADDIAAKNKRWSRAIDRLYDKNVPKQDDAGTDDMTSQQRAEAVRDAMPLPANALSALAGRRALAVKRVLVVELGLATDRVFIDASPDNKNPAARAQARLQVSR